MTQREEDLIPPPELWIAQNFARIRAERSAEESGWSLADVAQDLTDADCPMNKGSLSKIERGVQRIKLNEAEAFAKHLGLPLADLVLPPAVFRSKELRELVVAFREARDAKADADRASAAASERLASAEADIREHVGDDTELRALLIDELAPATQPGWAAISAAMTLRDPIALSAAYEALIGEQYEGNSQARKMFQTMADSIATSWELDVRHRAIVAEDKRIRAARGDSV